jgi:glycine/D-amino acid oxidase-like deaminating enzyme
MSASKHENLRTGTPVWTAYGKPRIARRMLQRNTACDVLIVGAGISGALTADLLSAEGFDVIVVDRREPFAGSTAASTALILHEIDTPLTKLSRKIGEHNAQRAWRRSFLAVHALEARTRELGISCSWKARDSIYLSGNILDAGGLKRERDARLTAGLNATYLMQGQTEERFGIKRPSLVSYGSFEVNPRELTAGYLGATLKRGVQLYAPTDIVKVEPGARKIHAHTKDGFTITCRHLVFATGYEVPKGVPARKYKIVSTYALATAPQPRNLWPGRLLIWEASEPYLYLRTTLDGRVIVGGEDEDISDDQKRDALLPKKISAIRKKMRRLLPDINTQPEFQWAGFFGTTETGLPLIGQVPGMKNCWAVLGYGGNGTTYSRIAAEIIRTRLTGGSDPDADLYSFPGA